jgi:hypothetical protein
MSRVRNIRLKNIDRLLKLPPGATAIYEVEPEVIQWAILHADFYLKRYKQHPAEHWTEREKRTTRTGLLGQKIFDVICQQLAVSKDHNDPVIDWRREKHYDFKIPDLGTIEVKSFDHYCRKVLVKVSEWHGDDYLVVFRLMDKTPSMVRMEGWLTKQQVESLPISKTGQKWKDGICYTPYAAAYITDFDKLNPASEFIFKLQRKSLLK